MSDPDRLRSSVTRPLAAPGGVDPQLPLSQPAQGRLHRRLSTFGVLLLTLSCLSPVFSVYGIGSDVLQHAGSGAVALFLLGIGAAIVWAVVYAELGSAYPYAGGDYVGVGSILGRWAGLVTLAIWAVTAGPSNAFEAKIIATYVGELAPCVPQPVVIFGALGAAVIIALLAVRLGAWVTGLFLAVEMAAVVALMLAGLSHPARSLGEVLIHPVALGHGGGLEPAAMGAMALAGVSAVYGTTGGNQAIYFGEELKDPHRRMGRVILMAGLIGALATALPVIAVVLGTGDLAAVLRSPAPIAAFMVQAAGTGAAHLLSAGVALAIFNALIAQVMAYSRLYFSLGRDRLLHEALGRRLAEVHASSGAPRTATLILGAFSAVCCLLSSHVLLIFVTGILVYCWGLVCLAVLIGRRRGLTGGIGYWRSPFYPLAPLLGLAMAIVFTLADLADPDAGRPSLIVLGLVVVASILWGRLVLSRRREGWRPTLSPPPS